MRHNLKRLFQSEHLRAAFVLAGLLLLFYRDVVFGGKTFLMENYIYGTMPASQGGGAYGYPGPWRLYAPLVRDAGSTAWALEPAERAARHILAQGEIPLWKAHVGLGSPFHGDGMSVPLDPLQILFYLWPEKWWTWGMDFQVLLRFFLAGWFTYVFARTIKIAFWPSVFAGTGYMLAWYFVIYGNNTQFRSEMLAPLVLYAFERLAEKPSFRPAFFTALTIAWVIAAGMPEAGFLVLMMGGMWYLYRLAWIVFRSPSPKPVLYSFLGWGSLAILSGIGLSTWYSLPVIENITLSVHNHTPGQGLLSYPLWTLVRMLVPEFLEGRSWYFNYHYMTLFVLAATAALAMGQLGKAKAPAIFFLGYASIFTLKLFGAPIVNWIGVLPIYNLITIPHYIAPTMALSLVMLAAIGLEYWGTSVHALRQVAVSCIFFAALIAACILSASIPVEFSKRLLFYSLCTVFGIMAIILLLTWGGEFFKLKRPFWVSFFLFLLVFEASLVQRSSGRPDRYDPYSPPPFLSYLRSQPQPYRIFGFDSIMHPNIAMAYGIDDIRYLDALESIRRHSFFQALIAPHKSKDRISGSEDPILFNTFFDLLNVRYLLAPPHFQLDEVSTAHDYKLVYDQEIKIYENPQALPRAFVLHGVRLASDMQGALDVLTRPGFDPTRIAVLEGVFPSGWDSRLLGSPLSDWTPAQVTNQTENTMEIRVHTDAPGILVVSESYFPGWHAFVDGQPTSLFPVDVLLRGVYLEAGEHTVFFSYLPLSFVIGSVMSSIVFVGLVAILFFQARPQIVKNTDRFPVEKQ